MRTNWANRTLFHGDNLPFMRAMNSDSVDLIATDPPFNKGRDFHVTPDKLKRGASFQDRWSWERDVHQEWVDQLTDDHPALMEAIESAIHAHSDGMGAYMCFMAVRLLAMRRILKPTGSIYLHCDPTASHYLKAVMDAIYGRRNFRNQIIWKRTESHNTAKRYGNIVDVLLYYSMSKTYTWNQQYHAHSDSQLKRYKHTDPDGRRYKLENLTAPRPDSDSGKFNWRGTMPGNTRGWGYRIDQLETWWSEGRIRGKKDGTPRMDGLKVYVDETQGKPVQSIWTDISRIPNTSSERTQNKYPTQKPLALYGRIISASSNEGDVVLDPFAGCATTCVSAERLNRQWVGIDIWEGAHDVVIERLKREGLIAPDGSKEYIFADGEIAFTKDLPTRTDDKETAAPHLQVKLSVKEPQERRMSRAEMYEILLSQQGIKCQGCDRTFDDPLYLELDHNTPRKDGGWNHISNRILLCSPCNRIKAHRFTLSGLREENRKRGRMRG